MASSDLDPTDHRIIALLEANARHTLGDIGRVIGMSAPAVKRRIDRLEESGVIIGYTAVIDHAKRGQPLEAISELHFSGNASVDDIARIADDIPEVAAVFTVAGDPDALAWIRVSDVHDLKRVIDRLRATEHVIGTKTLIVLGTSRRPHLMPTSLHAASRERPASRR